MVVTKHGSGRGPGLILAHCDLGEAHRVVDASSVDVIVTSPPYKRREGYSTELMKILGRLASHALAPGGRMFLNFGQLRSEGFETPFEARDVVAASSGLAVGQTIAWVKSAVVPTWRRDALQRVQEALKIDAESDHAALRGALQDLERYLQGPGTPLQIGHYQAINRRSPTLNYCWEPVFTFYKPPERPLDRLSIGVEFSDKSNTRRGTRGRDGDVHCAGDVWFVPYPTTGAAKKKAAAELEGAYSFPEELVRRCLKVASLRSDPPRPVVLDPFVGGGTSVCVARRLGYHAIGVDRSASALEVTLGTWKGVEGEG